MMSEFQKLINYWQNSLSIQQGIERKPGNHKDMYHLIIDQLNYSTLTNEISLEAAGLLSRSYLKEYENIVDASVANTINPESDYAECALKFAGSHRRNSKLWTSNLNTASLLEDLDVHGVSHPVLIPGEADIDLLTKYLPADFITTETCNKEVPILSEIKFNERECSSKMPTATLRNFKRHLISSSSSSDCEVSPKKANLQDYHTALKQLCTEDEQVKFQVVNSEQKLPREYEVNKNCGNMTLKVVKQPYFKNQQKRIGQPNSRSLFLTKSRPTHLFSKPNKLLPKTTTTNAKDETEICVDDKIKHIDPKLVELIMSEIMDHSAPVTWDDIAGLEFAKTTIKEIVIWPMLRPDLFTGLRGPPKGILLFGPPGTGKTLIGKCIASQTKSTFFSISASSLTSKWIGECEKLVKTLFTVARCHQPAVIFIDEIDSLLTQRSESEHESSRRIKTEFLVQLDGVTTSSNERLLVVGATNRPQELDEALRRRLVKRLYIPLPELEARRQIVKTLLRNHAHSLNNNDFDVICKNTDGYSGSDMANLCKEAALGPIRRLNFADIEHINEDEVEPISLKDFTDALKQVRASVSQNDLQCYVEWNEKYGSSAITKA